MNTRKQIVDNYFAGSVLLLVAFGINNRIVHIAESVKNDQHC
jgi:hypothetical protein